MLSDLVASLFTYSGPPRPDTCIGAELELIPIFTETKRRVGIHTSGIHVGTADIARAAGGTRGWSEIADAYGAPSWTFPDGGRISYEPGGQIEISSPVLPSAPELGGFLRDSVAALRESAAAHGVELLAVGIDPYNEIEQVSVELHATRYERMARHFARIGAAGERMMRQTASLQINVELGPDPLVRWALLNALAPYLTAMFANSRMYQNRPTEYASYRAHLWQQLDPSRTGLPYDAADPLRAYACFATAAARIVDDDPGHLSTLFPEVRPRGYFELRSVDSVEPERAARAIQFVSSILADADTTRAAQAIIGQPDPELLRRAAKNGSSDPLLGPRITTLLSLVGLPDTT